MRLNLRLTLLAFVVLLGCALLMSTLSFRQFEQSIAPAVSSKVDTVAASIEKSIGTALDIGIPFNKLQGMDEFFDSIRQANPEIYGIALFPSQGALYQSSGYLLASERPDTIITQYPLRHDNRTLGELKILIDGAFAQKKSEELRLDVLTVIIVSVIIAVELIVFIVSYNFSGPTQRIEFIRWPFFLLIFSESLSLSFFPVYVGQMQIPDLGLSREFVVGLPISLFMFIWALSLPGGGVWSDTVGRRRAFIFGALLTSIGLVLTAFAYSLFDLLLWRSMTAIGYGIVFITVQGFVTDHTDNSNRNRGMATFVATFFAGSLSGAAIGGILADHISMPIIFMLSALLSLGAALFVARFIVGGGGQARPKLTLASIRAVCRDRAFLMVTFFSAIPSKVALTGFLYFSAPLFLSSLEVSKSTTGRALMLYGLMIICLSPVVAQYAERLKSRLLLVLAGGVLGALAIAQLAWSPTLFGVMTSIALLGLAHAISVPSQLTFITETNQTLCNELGLGQVVGIFRLMERVGNILGPLIAGLFITLFGLTDAFIWLSLLIGAATVILGFWTLNHKKLVSKQ